MSVRVIHEQVYSEVYVPTCAVVKGDVKTVSEELVRLLKEHCEERGIELTTSAISFSQCPVSGRDRIEIKTETALHFFIATRWKVKT